jgi:hypothetical protein
MLKIHSFYPFFLDSMVLVDCFNLIKVDFMVFIRGLDPLDLNLMFLVDGFDVHVLYFNANNSQF